MLIIYPDSDTDGVIHLTFILVSLSNIDVAVTGFQWTYNLKVVFMRYT